MNISVYRGPVEGIVTYPVTCFITDDTKVCAYVEKFFYTLEVECLLAYPAGPAFPTLVKRIESGDQFVYRRRHYRKLTPDESQSYVGKTYIHVMPVTPDSIRLMFQ